MAEISNINVQHWRECKEKETLSFQNSFQESFKENQIPSKVKESNLSPTSQHHLMNKLASQETKSPLPKEEQSMTELPREEEDSVKEVDFFKEDDLILNCWDFGGHVSITFFATQNHFLCRRSSFLFTIFSSLLKLFISL